MKDLKGRVAVVTGAARGLGRAMALAFADQGMHVALGDVAETSDVFAAVQAKGVSALSMKLDVSNAAEVEAFAAMVERDLGPAFLVCNNAGVSPLGAAWETSVGDWQWILGVNLWGVIHGVRSFVPRLIERGEGHVVNTASVAGIINPRRPDEKFVTLWVGVFDLANMSLTYVDAGHGYGMMLRASGDSIAALSSNRS